MKIALAQLNFIVNDIEGNRTKIISTIRRAKQAGANLAVFSELSVCGYPPHDLLNSNDFIDRCTQSVKRIAQECVGITAIIGCPTVNPNHAGKPLYNSALVLSNGEVTSTHHKALLPTYDIFDEYRYFEPSKSFTVATIEGKQVAVTVCEDIWDDQPITPGVARSRLYTLSPMEQLMALNPELVINIAASPFSYDSHERRLNVFQGNIKRFGLPVMYVNQVGANTDLIFDGGSMALNSHGEIHQRLNLFCEDFQIIDTDSLSTNTTPNHNRIELIHDALVLGVKDYFSKLGFTKATLGLSGGIDSAVTLAIAQRALGSENIRVLLMPSQYSSQHSVDDAVGLANNLGVEYDTINIESSFNSLQDSLTPIFKNLPNDLAEENIQARIRGTLLMALSNKLGHLLLNTSNKSEAAVGYGTLYGDMNGALSVLGDVYKTDVFALAQYINRSKEIIPNNTIIKPPSAELRPNQKDSDSLPDYDTLDSILFQYIEGQKSAKEIINLGFNPETVNRTIRMVNTTEHKRYQSPPTLRVSSKAFGAGRRMPLVARW